MKKVKILTSEPWPLIFISIHDENIVFKTMSTQPKTQKKENKITTRRQ